MQLTTLPQANGLRDTVRTVCLAGALAAVGAAAPSSSPPALPYESPGVCPFECCTYRNWTVEADTDVRVDRTEAAATAFRVRRGQRVRGITGVVVTRKFGHAAVRRGITIGTDRPVKLEPGDEVLIVHYVGEGYWKFWVRGRLDQDQLPGKDEDCANEFQEPVECAIQIFDEPDAKWWAKIRGRDGREGWTSEMNHFGNIDACE